MTDIDKPTIVIHNGRRYAVWYPRTPDADLTDQLHETRQELAAVRVLLAARRPFRRARVSK